MDAERRRGSQAQGWMAHRARSAQQPPLPLSRGKGTDMKLGGLPFWATAVRWGGWDVCRGRDPLPQIYLSWAWRGMEKGPRVRLGQLSLVRCCLSLNKCYLRFRCLCGTLLRVLIRFYLDLLCFCRARRFWTAFAAASMFVSCVLGREVPVLYNRLNLVWHLLVDCQRGEKNFLMSSRPPLFPAQTDVCECGF